MRTPRPACQTSMPIRPAPITTSQSSTDMEAPRYAQLLRTCLVAHCPLLSMLMLCLLVALATKRGQSPTSPQVSQYCAQHMHSHLLEHLTSPSRLTPTLERVCCHQLERRALESALVRAFSTTDAQVAATVPNSNSCGTTACVAIVTDAALVVANCGTWRISSERAAPGARIVLQQNTWCGKVRHYMPHVWVCGSSICKLTMLGRCSRSSL